MNSRRSNQVPSADPRLHVATFPYNGYIWDTYLEFHEDYHRPRRYLGLLRFDRAGTGEGTGSAQTAVIFIEDSYEETIVKARAMDERQLEALLRSSLPDANG